MRNVDRLLALLLGVVFATAVLLMPETATQKSAATTAREAARK